MENLNIFYAFCLWWLCPHTPSSFIDIKEPKELHFKLKICIIKYLHFREACLRQQLDAVRLAVRAFGRRAARKVDK